MSRTMHGHVRVFSNAAFNVGKYCALVCDDYPRKISIVTIKQIDIYVYQLYSEESKEEKDASYFPS